MYKGGNTLRTVRYQWAASTSPSGVYFANPRRPRLAGWSMRGHDNDDVGETFEGIFRHGGEQVSAARNTFPIPKSFGKSEGARCFRATGIV
jgi:hypothetical protein